MDTSSVPLYSVLIKGVSLYYEVRDLVTLQELSL